MSKTKSYRLDSQGPPGRPEPPNGGTFRLSDGSWSLVYGPTGGGVTCGLLRSRVEVQATRRRRRCRVTVTEEGESGLTATFVLRARAADVRVDLEGRLASIDRASEVITAVEGGAWWRGADAFAALGWSRTLSVAGVRRIGGDGEAGRARPMRLARVLDLGPNGVRLRGWRTRWAIPWEDVASIEVSDPAPLTDAPTASAGRGGSVVTVRNRGGERVVLQVALKSPSQLRTELRTPPLDRVVRGLPVPELTVPTAGSAPSTAGSVPIGPSVPRLSPG